MAKVDPKKVVAAAKAKLKNNPVTHAITGMFSKLGKKTGANKKKVTEWQNKWLTMPKNRKKYESLKDAPDVMGEEMFAMMNDIIDFTKGEHKGQSHVFKKLKEESSALAKNPKGYVKQKVAEGKKKVLEAKKMAAKKVTDAKKAAAKGGKGGGAHKKLDEIVEKAKAGLKKAKERATKGMAEAKKRAQAKAAEAKKAAGAAAKKARK